MKLTIPAPQNIKRREAFLLKHKDTLPLKYVHAQLMRIAMERAEKKLRWEQPYNQVKMEERKAESAKRFEIIPKKQPFFKRMSNVFKSQRGA